MAKNGNVGPGQGMGAGYVNFEPVRFVDERPTEYLNPKESSARRGEARMTDGARSGGRKTGGNPGSQDAGGV